MRYNFFLKSAIHTVPEGRYIEIKSAKGDSIKFVGLDAQNLLWSFVNCLFGAIGNTYPSSLSGSSLAAARQQVWPILDAIIGGGLKNHTDCAESMQGNGGGCLGKDEDLEIKDKAKEE